MISYQATKQLHTLYSLRAMGHAYVDALDFSNAQEELQIPMASSHEALIAQIKHCHLCDLSKVRKQAFWGLGTTSSDLFFVGDYPSLAEESGAILHGNAGQKFVEMVEKVLERSVDSIYYTHAVKCMPSGGRHPVSSEVLSCKPFLLKQIEMVTPKLIVTLGELSYNYFTSNAAPFDNAVGEIQTFQGYALMPLYHPKFILQNPSYRAPMFEHLKKIANYLCVSSR
ncbi:MAG: hypothetical protein KU37_10110 [Sulfuricurvum sp. PC08-66]|nr:MAG: hypothetical protein KU37_10110 [Sulfuricurvum sp. PC08-66]